MRIGMFTKSYVPTPDGVAYYVKGIQDAMSAMGHEVYIFTNTEHASQPFSDKNNIIRFPSLPFLPYPEYRVALFPFKKARKIAREKELDIIHIHTPFILGTTGYLAGKKEGIPRVATFHTNFVEMKGSLDGKILNEMFDVGWKYSKVLFKNCDAVIAPTQKMADLLISEDVCNSVNVVWNGVDPEQFNDPENKNRDISRFDIPEKRPIILFLSRVTRDKGVYTLLDASEKLYKEHGAVILVAGTGPEKTLLEAEAKRMGAEDRFRVLGYVSDEEKLGLYAQADVFVLPSKAETFGIVLLEAMASGTPVVAADSGGITEVVTDGENGLLFEYDDHEALAEKLGNILTDAKLRAKLVDNGRTFVNKKATIEESAKKTLAIYESLLRK